MLSCCFLHFSVGVVGVGAYNKCYKTESDLFLFLLVYIKK